MRHVCSNEREDILGKCYGHILEQLSFSLIFPPSNSPYLFLKFGLLFLLGFGVLGNWLADTRLGRCLGLCMRHINVTALPNSREAHRKRWKREEGGRKNVIKREAMEQGRRAE